MVKRKTASSRLKRALATLSEWCRKNLHAPIKEQHQKLVQKLRGHYGYYGIIGNYYSSGNTGRKCERSGDASYLGDAETVM